MNCYIIISDKLGGAEQVLLQLAKNSNKVEVCVYESQNTNLWQNNGFEPYYCNGSFMIFVQYFKGKKFERVYSSNLMINAALGFFRQMGILKTEKLICRESTSVFSRYKGFKLMKYKTAYRLGYKKIDLVITQSEQMKSELIKHMPFLSKRTNIQTISNPFDFPTIRATSKEVDYTYMVAAGRLIPEKGFDILIDAFSIIKQKTEDLKLVILGEGQEREILEYKINSLNLHKDVILQGFVNDVYPWFRGAEMCVVSSIIEGFPNVLLQMMSQNDKVVSTLCAGGIEDLKGVFTCPVGDIQALYKTMITALSEDTIENRKLFDEELENRSVNSFIEKINSYINE